jgi:hypothetical protein
MSDTLADLVEEVRALRRKVEFALSDRQTNDGQQLLTASQIDRMYRLKHGTASSSAKANRVASITRPGRGGRPTIYISAADARAMWGAL